MNEQYIGFPKRREHKPIGEYHQALIIVKESVRKSRKKQTLPNKARNANIIGQPVLVMSYVQYEKDYWKLMNEGKLSGKEIDELTRKLIKRGKLKVVGKNQWKERKVVLDIVDLSKTPKSGTDGIHEKEENPGIRSLSKMLVKERKQKRGEETFPIRNRKEAKRSLDNKVWNGQKRAEKKKKEKWERKMISLLSGIK